VTGRSDRLFRLSWGPWVFVAMFAVFLGANLTLGVVAYNSWTGLETEGAYRKGVAYNQHLEAARAQEALGWQVEIDLIAIDSGRARLAAEIRDRNGRAVRPRSVTAELIRPTHSGYDLTLPLLELSAGSYGAEFDLPLRGQWDVRILAAHGAGTHQSQRRMVLR